jgi:hypothetical protein
MANRLLRSVLRKQHEKVTEVIQKNIMAICFHEVEAIQKAYGVTWHAKSLLLFFMCELVGCAT